MLCLYVDAEGGMMKLFLNFALFLLSQNIYAQATPNNHGSAGDNIFSIGSYNITIPEEWLYKTETRSDQRTITTIYHPDGIGTLQFMSLNTAPKVVTQEFLRNMTNVDSSISLNWQMWGDFNGYQYDYSENEKIYRQWWLANKEEMIFIVYSTDTQDDFESNVINRIVTSITAVN
jgi:hypothetical protein